MVSSYFFFTTPFTHCSSPLPSLTSPVIKRSRLSQPFSAVNNSLAFYENKVSFAEDSAISLRQNSIKYEYIDTVYKVEGFYFNDNFFESEHYILVSKNGDRIDTGYYLNNANSEFEKNVLPLLLKNGCTLKEIKSEEEIK